MDKSRRQGNAAFKNGNRNYGGNDMDHNTCGVRENSTMNKAWKHCPTCRGTGDNGDYLADGDWVTEGVISLM